MCVSVCLCVLFVCILNVIPLQAVALLSFVLWLVGLGSHTLQRAHQVWRANPLRCAGWAALSLLAVLLQVRALLHSSSCVCILTWMCCGVKTNAALMCHIPVLPAVLFGPTLHPVHVSFQICYCLVHTAIVGAPNIFLAYTVDGHTPFSWYVWVLACLWPVVLWCWTAFLKGRDLVEHDTVMRRARLRFTTRLGRYSPRSARDAPFSRQK